MHKHRVVITGIGWITPLGHDIETAWRHLLAGQSGITPIAHFDASTFPTTFAAQVKNYDHSRYVRRPQLHQGVGENTAFALGAASQAWTCARFDQHPVPAHRLGVYLGAGECALDFDNYVASALHAWEPATSKVNTASWALQAQQRMQMVREIEQEPHMPLTHLALEFDAQGPVSNCLTACAASTQAIGEATQMLRRGDADVMITGGTHSMIHPFGLTGFNRLTALSTRNDSPTTASRPFCFDRDGFVIGEGAGILILETLEHAQQRQATILAEIIGYGSTADAYRITDIHPEGRGAALSMKKAMRDADITPADIHYISAHGTGTSENDRTETHAVKSVFGQLAKQTPMSSIKSAMGHLIAAAGAVELITCVLAIRDQILPPTINLHTPDPDCDLDYVPNAARQAKVEICLSNSFGFGGQNDTLIVRKWTGL